MLNTDKKLRIVIIDDSDTILAALKAFFEGYDFEVHTTLDGLGGIQLCSEVKPDLVFLDLMMPNFDGIKFLQVKSVLKDIKDIPVIVISANTNKRNVLSAIELGASKVISKPLQKDVIIKTLKEVLNKEVQSPTNFKTTMADAPEEKVRESIHQNLNIEMRSHLKKIFLDNFKIQKQQIEYSLHTRNKAELDRNLHEIKGAGGTIGYNEITKCVKEIEDRAVKTDLDWFFIQVRWEQILKTVKEIETSIVAGN